MDSPSGNPPHNDRLSSALVYVAVRYVKPLYGTDAKPAGFHCIKSGLER